MGKRTRYATLTKDKPVASDKFLTVLKEGFVSMDMAQNILVIKTAPWNGNGCMCSNRCTGME